MSAGKAATPRVGRRGSELKRRQRSISAHGLVPARSLPHQEC